MVRNMLANARDVRDPGRSLGGEDPQEEETATHSTVPAWRIPRTEQHGGLQSMRLQKTQTQLSTHAHSIYIYVSFAEMIGQKMPSFYYFN